MPDGLIWLKFPDLPFEQRWAWRSIIAVQGFRCTRLTSLTGIPAARVSALGRPLAAEQSPRAANLMTCRPPSSSMITTGGEGSFQASDCSSFSSV